jgi:hypothetical protein
MRDTVRFTPDTARWRELAQQIAQEKDPDKLIQLAEDLNAELAKAREAQRPVRKSA